jgi:carboxypeptidase C (cathepsin A)
LGLATVKI